MTVCQILSHWASPGYFRWLLSEVQRGQKVSAWLFVASGALFYSFCNFASVTTTNKEKTTVFLTVRNGAAESAVSQSKGKRAFNSLNRPTFRKNNCCFVALFRAMFLYVSVLWGEVSLLGYTRTVCVQGEQDRDTNDYLQEKSIIWHKTLNKKWFYWYKNDFLASVTTNSLLALLGVVMCNNGVYIVSFDSLYSKFYLILYVCKWINEIRTLLLIYFTTLSIITNKLYEVSCWKIKI